MQADTNGNIQNDIIHMFATFDCRLSSGDLFFETEFDATMNVCKIFVCPLNDQFKESGGLRIERVTRRTRAYSILSVAASPIGVSGSL